MAGSLAFACAASQPHRTSGTDGEDRAGGAPGDSEGGAGGRAGRGGDADAGGAAGGQSASDGAARADTDAAVVSAIDAAVESPGPGPGAADGSAPDDTPVTCARMIPVGAPAALGPAISAAIPGDCLVVADGTYGGLSIAATGTEASPIVVSAAHRLKAVLTGAVQFAKAAHVVLEGFSFTGGANLSINDSTHCRVSRSFFKLGGGTWIQISGSSDGTRIDHCELGPGSLPNANAIYPTGMSTNTLIDHNYLHDLVTGHVITVGCCGAAFDGHETGDVIEHNLFVMVDGGGEVISIKSSNSTVRYNTFRGNRGDVDIRAGHKDAIYGNYLFGPSSSGIRMYDTNHLVYNNYVETSKALQMGPAGPIHAADNNATVVFNTFIGPVKWSGDMGTTFANNIVVGSIAGGASPGAKYQGNIVSGGASPGGAGFTMADPKLVRSGDVLTLAAGSPAIGAAVGQFAFIMDDVAGHARPKPDVGAEQLASDPTTRPVLKPADVGPDAP